ncbi:MAG TPA: HAD hydrolase-like protein, partial [Acidimicrobiales bacterium]|nr:HAD hydrolase-like protein [Acidimicrobiales bacterium]
PTVDELVARLAGAGVEARPEEIVTSAQAAAGLLDPGTTAFACAETGVVEALNARGVTVVGEGPADAVVVGWTRQFDFTLLDVAAGLVRAGARFVGTNEDATFPTPDRLLPGAGSVLAAVATAAQAQPEVAGKPHRPMVDLLHARAGEVGLVVGDRPSTDGLLAERLGAPFALVRSGVTGGDGREPMVVNPHIDAPDLAAVVERQLA